MKNIVKNFLLSASFLLGFTMILQALPNREAANSPLIIYGLRGPSGIGIIRLFEEGPQVPGFDVRVVALAQSSLVAARFIAGEAKIGILPPDAAAKIASSGQNIKIAAVIGMGMLSLITSDPQVQNMNDLRGKTVEVAGQGVVPDYVFRRLLLEKGLRPETDVRLGYSLAYPEIAQSLIAGRVSTALLPEPFASMALSRRPEPSAQTGRELRVIGNIQDEWRQIAGGDNFPTTVLAVDGDFAMENPEAINIILRDIANSIKWTMEHPTEAGILAEKHELGFAQGIAAQAIPKSNYVFIPALEARSALENLFKVFLDFSPVSIGGVLPSESFYWH
jgi:NitT/TauT family transport system substrate-binding protein